jgi:hypothetical protein
MGRQSSERRAVRSGLLSSIRTGGGADRFEDVKIDFGKYPKEVKNAILSKERIAQTVAVANELRSSDGAAA